LFANLLSFGSRVIKYVGRKWAVIIILKIVSLGCQTIHRRYSFMFNFHTLLGQIAWQFAGDILPKEPQITESKTVGLHYFIMVSNSISLKLLTVISEYELSAKRSCLESRTFLLPSLRK